MKRSIEINNQIKFCSELMRRIEKDLTEDMNLSSIENVDKYKSWGTFHYTQRRADIIRLRRELLTLSNLIKADYGE